MKHNKPQDLWNLLFHKEMRTQAKCVKNQNFQNSVKRLSTIWQVFVQETGMNLSKNSELWGVGTCPAAISLPTSVVPWKPTAHNDGENQQSGNHWGGRSRDGAPQKPRPQRTSLLTCPAAPWKAPFLEFVFIWPTQNSPCANSTTPGPLSEKNQQHLPNMAAAWGSQTSWSQREDDQKLKSARRKRKLPSKNSICSKIIFETAKARLRHFQINRH